MRTAESRGRSPFHTSSRVVDILRGRALCDKQRRVSAVSLPRSTNVIVNDTVSEGTWCVEQVPCNLRMYGQVRREIREAIFLAAMAAAFCSVFAQPQGFRAGILRGRIRERAHRKYPVPQSPIVEVADGPIPPCLH